MSWPTDDLSTSHLDAGTDNPALARAQIKAAIDKLKAILALLAPGDVLLGQTGGDGRWFELDGTGVITGNVTIRKEDGMITFESPDASKRYRLIADISNADEYGFVVQRWNGSTWVEVFKLDASGGAVLSSKILAESSLASEAEVKAGTSTTKPPSVASLRGGLLVAGTAQASTSGSEILFTGIPAWARRVTMLFRGVSLTTGDQMGVQLGTGSGLEVIDYASGAFSQGNTTRRSDSFVLMPSGATGAGALWHGSIVFDKIESNTWVAQGAFTRSDSDGAASCAGSKTLAGPLTQLAAIAHGGAFDAGSINVVWE